MIRALSRPAPWSPARVAGWAVVLLAAARCPAQAPHRPLVSGHERFHAEPAPGADLRADGRLLLSELNCQSCHRPEGAGAVARKQAPILDGVGTRVRPEYLVKYIFDPHGTRPGTTMPDALRNLPEADRWAIAEDIAHFLAGTGRAVDAAPNRSAVRAGRGAYARVGCVACHGPREEGQPGTPEATRDAHRAGLLPLGDLAAKYTVGSLAAFLRDPLAVRPSGRMPSLDLSADEARGVASYLMRGVEMSTAPNVAFQAYEGSWTTLPDFDKLTPKRSGMAGGFDLDQARRPNNFALRFEGIFEVAQPGEYTFRLRSDDGSRLILNDLKVFDNDGIHPASEVTGVTRMGPGRAKVVVLYFDGGGETELEVEVEGPGLPRQPLDPLLLPPNAAGAEAVRPAGFTVDPEKAARGKSLFAGWGCASCHTLKDGAQPIPARPDATPLARLRPDQGCLADRPPTGVPGYDLDPVQRAALRSVVGPAAQAAPADDRERVRDTLLAANCFACHKRDGMGGVADLVNAAFATTQTEMGDEGRIPPGLDGVGGKLTAAWLAKILAEGAKDRPYMQTRMPRFGARNVGHLAGLFEAADRLPPLDPVDLGVSDKRARAIGRSLVGNTGFSCGSCHTFKGIEANGIQAIDMTRMTTRLRREWFSRYVVDPQKYRPGTRMPSNWTDGKSLIESAYHGDAAPQVEAIWTYLSDGDKAAVPAGVGRNPIPLIPVGEPIVYRNFIQGAGPRAIGVGYPERANLAFDADALRPALIWRGGFIDASRHWSGRGEGFEPPLGDDVVTLPPGPGLAPLADPAAPWPARAGESDRFRGYRLADRGRPVFLYEVAGAAVEDGFEPIPNGTTPTLRRTVEVRGPVPPGLALRAAVGSGIEPAGDGWFSVDGEWRVRIESGAAPAVRPSAGKSELIVPIANPGGAGRTRIIEEYRW